MSQVEEEDYVVEDGGGARFFICFCRNLLGSGRSSHGSWVFVRERNSHPDIWLVAGTAEVQETNGFPFQGRKMLG